MRIVPGATFANPGTPLRAALTRAAGERTVAITAAGGGAAKKDKEKEKEKN